MWQHPAEQPRVGVGYYKRNECNEWPEQREQEETENETRKEEKEYKCSG
jgi:hypothetical protein